jgi:hypothetical protein
LRRDPFKQHYTAITWCAQRACFVRIGCEWELDAYVLRTRAFQAIGFARDQLDVKHVSETRFSSSV